MNRAESDGQVKGYDTLKKYCRLQLSWLMISPRNRVKYSTSHNIHQLSCRIVCNGFNDAGAGSCSGVRSVVVLCTAAFARSCLFGSCPQLSYHYHVLTYKLHGAQICCVTKVLATRTGLRVLRSTIRRYLLHLRQSTSHVTSLPL